MACGLPVVAYDLPRTRWIVGEAGRLCPIDDPDELSRMISRALAEGPDRAEASVARASGFRWEEIARQYRSFFEELVGQQRGLPV
jgi:glycosyltransferase involved in cell wall biosynthesis